MNAILAKEVIIEIDELGLSQSREQLALLHAVQSAVSMQLASATGHSATGYQDDLMPHRPEPCHLIHHSRDTGDIQLPVCTCKNVGPYLDYISHVSFLILLPLPFVSFYTCLQSAYHGRGESCVLHLIESLDGKAARRGYLVNLLLRVASALLQ